MAWNADISRFIIDNAYRCITQNLAPGTVTNASWPVSDTFRNKPQSLGTIYRVWSAFWLIGAVTGFSEKKSRISPYLLGRDSQYTNTNPHISHPCASASASQRNSTPSGRTLHFQGNRAVESGKVYIGRLHLLSFSNWCKVVTTDRCPGSGCSLYSITVYGYLCSYLCWIMFYFALLCLVL